MSNSDSRLDNSKTQTSLKPMNLEPHPIAIFCRRATSMSANVWCLSVFWMVILIATKVLGCHGIANVIIFVPIVASSLGLWLLWVITLIVNSKEQ